MVDNLNDLKKLFILCRKQGITELDLHGLKVKFGDLPSEVSHTNKEQDEIDPEDPWKNFPTGLLSQEQLAFYSAGGSPDEDPQNGADQ